MHPAAAFRRCAVTLVALATCALGCGASPKKKVATEETSHVDEDPAPRWESAGETLPPEKKPEKPPEKPPEKAPDKAEKPGPKTANAGKPPAKAAAAAPAPKTPPAKKGAPPPKTASNKKGAPGSSAPGVNDEQLLQPVLTLDSVASSAPPPPSPSPPPAAAPSPAPPPAPAPPKKTETVVARVDPPAAAPPPPRAEDNLPPPKIERQKIDPSESTASSSTSTSAAAIDAAAARMRERDRDRDRERDRERAIEREMATTRELHAMIGGKPVLFRTGVVLGNKRTGYALQVFESPGSTNDAELDANIEVDLDRHRDLEKRKLIPLKLIYLQIADPTSKSDKGFRVLECRGRGQIVFESLPPLPKRLPQDQSDIGDTVANLALSATCTRDSAEFGSFVIEGRVVMRVLILPADM